MTNSLEFSLRRCKDSSNIKPFLISEHNVQLHFTITSLFSAEFFTFKLQRKEKVGPKSSRIKIRKQNNLTLQEFVLEAQITNAYLSKSNPLCVLNQDTRSKWVGFKLTGRSSRTIYTFMYTFILCLHNLCVVINFLFNNDLPFGELNVKDSEFSKTSLHSCCISTCA